MYVVHEACGHTKSGQGRCKRCYNRAYFAANPDKRPTSEALRLRYATDPYDPRRVAQFKFHYGMTPDVYAEMLEGQGGLCAICGGKTNRNLNVDHDHETKALRGLLCGRCNTMLGLALESPDILEIAAEYLRVHGAG